MDPEINTAPTPPDAGARNPSRRAILRPLWPLLALTAGALVLAWLAGALTLPELPDLPAFDASASLWLVALTGLSVGGVSCLAVQGGLLASTVAQRAKRLADEGRAVASDAVGFAIDVEPTTAMAATAAPATALSRALPVVQFQLAKLVAYTALGAVLGGFGSQLSARAQGLMMLAAAAFMIVVALQQYDAHPALRRIAFQPPKRVQRAVRGVTRRGDALGPWLLGAATVLIPCGVTLAMEGLAIASRSAGRGAAIMAVFTLGTAPLFLLLGLFASGLSGASYRLFRPLATAALVVVAALTFQSGLRLTGAVAARATGPQTVAERVVDDVGAPAFQRVAIRAVDSAYVPDALRIKAGVSTRLTLTADAAAGCTRAFTIPSLGIQETVAANGETLIVLPPLEPGDVSFVCGMGMFGGVIEVVP